MAFQVYVDDSGAKGQIPPVLVLAGLTATAEAWLSFSDRWRTILDTPPAIKYFKMREAAGCSGQFRHWREESRDAKLKALAQAINEISPGLVYVAVELQGFGAIALEKQAVKPLSEAYFFPFYILILSACDQLWDDGAREEVEFIFDRHEIFEHRWELWYPAVRRIVERRNPERYPLLPPTLIFRPDEKWLPLQAADLFAWNIRLTEANEPNKFDWLTKECDRVRVSRYSRILNEASMREIVERGEQSFTREELLEIFREIIGLER